MLWPPWPRGCQGRESAWQNSGLLTCQWKRSSPSGPALQDVGGSFCRSCSKEGRCEGGTAVSGPAGEAPGRTRNPRKARCPADENRSAGLLCESRYRGYRWRGARIELSRGSTPLSTVGCPMLPEAALAAGQGKGLTASSFWILLEAMLTKYVPAMAPRENFGVISCSSQVQMTRPAEGARGGATG